MRTSIAYFAGAGTVVAAIAAGLGGGLLMANIMNPHEAREVSKLEQRRAAPQQAQQSPQPNAQQGTPSTVAASNGPQAPTPYQAATQQAATKPVVVAPAPSNSPQPSSEASNAVPQAAPPAQPKEQSKEQPKETAAANELSAQTAPSTKPADAPVSKQRQKPQEQASTQPAAREDQASSPDNAYAKARDADVKRQAAEQRKAERRQQWFARRQQRDQEMRDVEQKVREDSDSREVIVQRDDSDRPRFFDSDRPRDDDSDRPRNSGGPMRAEFPRINLFGPD